MVTTGSDIGAATSGVVTTGSEVGASTFEVATTGSALDDSLHRED